MICDWILRQIQWHAGLHGITWCICLCVVLWALVYQEIRERVRARALARFENDEIHAREDEGMSEFCYDVPKRGDH